MNDIKVFCVNCKWLWKEDEWGNSRCRVIKYETIEDSFFKKGGSKRKNVHIATCENKNRNNKCLDYKRKLWKFWVYPKRFYETKIEQVMHDIID